MFTFTSGLSGPIHPNEPSGATSTEAPATASFAGIISSLRESVGSILSDFDLVRFGKLFDTSDDASSNRLSSPELAPLVAYSLWATEFRLGLNALTDAYAACQKYKRSELSPSSTGLSLVVYDGGVQTDQDECNTQVVLVQWVVGGKTGRIADLDSEGRVITIVPSGAKRVPINFEKNTIVHPSFGTTMERVKRSERPKLPTHIERLMRMWRVALQADHMPEHVALQLIQQDESKDIVDLTSSGGAAQALVMDMSSCCFCGSNSSFSPFVGATHQKHDDNGPSSSTAARDSNQEFIQQCCLCLHYWHRSCSLKLLDHIGINSSSSNHSSDGSANRTDSIMYTITGLGSSLEHLSRDDNLSHQLSISHLGSFAPDHLPPCFRLSGKEDDMRLVVSGGGGGVDGDYYMLSWSNGQGFIAVTSTVVMFVIFFFPYLQVLLLIERIERTPSPFIKACDIVGHNMVHWRERLILDSKFHNSESCAMLAGYAVFAIDNGKLFCP